MDKRKIGQPPLTYVIGGTGFEKVEGSITIVGGFNGTESSVSGRRNVQFDSAYDIINEDPRGAGRIASGAFKLSVLR